MFQFNISVKHSTQEFAPGRYIICQIRCIATVNVGIYSSVVDENLTNKQTIVTALCQSLKLITDPSTCLDANNVPVECQYVDFFSKDDSFKLRWPGARYGSHTKLVLLSFQPTCCTRNCIRSTDIVWNNHYHIIDNFQAMCAVNLCLGCLIKTCM